MIYLKKIFQKFFRVFNNFSVRTKLVILFSLLIGLISSFIFFYFPARFESKQLELFKEYSHNLLEVTSNNISSALFFEDYKSLGESLSGTIIAKNIAYIVVQNRNDSLVYSYNLKRAAIADYLSTNYEYSDDGTVYKLLMKVTCNGQNVGGLYIGLIITGIREEMYNGKIWIAIVSLILFLACFGLIFSISTLITNPLKKIVSTFGKVAAKDFSVRADYSFDDELGHLAASFNLMMKELQEAYNHLEELNEKLKMKVEVLTATENELTRAKSELMISLEKEQELSELKSRFISMISHEYRTPLTVIQTSADLLEQSYLKSNFSIWSKYISRIRNSVKSLTHLLDDVLTHSRMETIRDEHKPVAINIIEHLREIIEEFSITYKNSNEIRFISDTGKSIVILDVYYFNQAMINIISNALKYSGQGGPVTVELIEDEKKLSILVKDNGIGIPEESQGFIFEPFYRSKNVGTTSGTGLGMPIVKRAVEMMGGSVSLRSMVGIGTTVEVIIPKYQEEDV